MSLGAVLTPPLRQVHTPKALEKEGRVLLTGRQPTYFG